MPDESLLSRVPFVVVLSVLVVMSMCAVWMARLTIHQQAARYVRAEWQQRLNDEIERGNRASAAARAPTTTAMVARQPGL